MTTTRLIADRYSFNTKDTLGQGGMGTVYKGKDTQTGEWVAVKSLRKDIIRQNPEVVKRFRREGEALSQLNHPNIVKMLSYCEDDNDHYLVMEYVGGGSLYDLLQLQPQLSIQRALYIALDIADSLTRAHRLDILHRDIKPANVLLAEDGTPRLTDFGMALVGKSHVTASGAIVGTLSYLSPEALNGEELDERTDIWAYGVMLYEMLAGRRPFEHDRAGSLISMILTQSVPDLETMRPDLPTSLVDLIYRMLIKDRNTRIPSVRVVGAELEAIIRGTGTTIQPVVIADSSGRFDTTTQTQVATDELVIQHNLPPQPTTFIGREQEIRDLRDTLLDPKNQLVTLLGPGGIGKTRLAIELGKQVFEHFADGVYIVPLASLEDERFILQAIAEGTQFAFGRDGDVKTQLFSYLHEKQMLLILDNFEHLVHSANLVAEILSQATQLKIIVTSRERLRLRGESIYELQGLPLPNETMSVETLLDYAVVQLFLQNAQRIMPNFALDEETALYVVRISHMVQGLPLGIELAAGWLEALNINEISQEIEQSIDFLETDLRDVPERHRSMRAVFDYSWNLLTNDERDSFMKLAVFRGGFEREAAQRIVGANLRALTGLVNKSLLRRDSMGRYDMSKLLRQYAEEKLTQEGNPDAVQAEHAMYYGEFLHKLEGAFGTKHERKALEAIEMELQNIRMAWDWGIANGMWDKLDGLLNTISLFYQNRSILRQGAEAISELAEALKAAGYGENCIYYWRARIRETLLRGRTGEFATTLRYMPQAAAFFKDTDEVVEYAYTQNLIGYACMMQGQLEESRPYILEAKSLIGDLTHTDAWFFTIGNLGYLEFLAGNYQEAKRIYETLVENNQDSDYLSVGYGIGLNNLGEILRALGELDRAKTLFTQAYELFKSFHSLRGMAFSMNNLAGIHFLCGDYEVAKSMYERAYEINKEIGDLVGIGHSLSALGNAALFAGQVEQAVAHYNESMKIRRELGNRKGVADSLSDLAMVAMMREQHAEAQVQFQEALTVYRQISDRAGEGVTLSGIGLTALMMGNPDYAKEQFDQALAIGEMLNAPEIIVQALAGLGEYWVSQQGYDTAWQYFVRVMELNRKTHFPTLTLYALSSMALVAMETGDYEQALRLASVVVATDQHYTYIPITYTRAQQVVATSRTCLDAATAVEIENSIRGLPPSEVAEALLQAYTE